MVKGPLVIMIASMLLCLNCSDGGLVHYVNLGCALFDGSSTRDVVADQHGVHPFAAVTMKSLDIELSLVDREGRPIERALVRGLTEDRGEICRAVSDAGGRLQFPCLMSVNDEFLNLVAEHPSCDARSIAVVNPHAITAVVRVIALRRTDSLPMVATDRDSDGIPDSLDQFPDDPRLVGMVERSFMIAFDDDVSSHGDGDYNDLVVGLTIREYLNPGNMVNKIAIRTRVLASGSEQINSLWITIAGREYLLVDNPRIDLGVSWNTRRNERFVSAPERELTIMPENPLPRAVIGPLPYGPFIKINGKDDRQVHLSSLPGAGAAQAPGPERTPGVILVPMEWAWPIEGESIESAYPAFRSWIDSEGRDAGDWYRYPDASAVYHSVPEAALAVSLVRAIPGLRIDAAMAGTGTLLSFMLVIGLFYRRSRGAG